MAFITNMESRIFCEGNNKLHDDLYMNKKIGRLSISLFIPLLLISANSNAEIYPYIGFSLGESASDENCETDPYYSCEGTGTSGAIFAGARLNQNLAIEASYIDMGELSKSNDTSWVTAESKGTNFSLIGIITTSSPFIEFFGKVGLLYWDTTISGSDLVTGPVNDNGTDVSLGIGVSFGLDKYAFRVEFERLNKFGDEYAPGGSIITIFSAGVVVYF